MTQRLTILFLFIAFSICYSQNQNLIGKWILVKTMFNNGQNIEINNPNYSTKIIYLIKPDLLQINDQKFQSTFNPVQIITQFRKINYVLKDKYLIAQDEGDNKKSYFLKLDDFIQKNPEFSLKEIEKNGQTYYVDNYLSGFEFNNDLSFEEFITKNIKDRDSKDFKNLNFQIEFVLTTDNKIQDIKVINSIDESFDNEYINALKKSERFLKNISGKNLIIHDEINQLKWANDLNDKDEKKLYQIRAKGLEYYRINKFEKSIEQFAKVENLNIKNNRFKTLIKECLIHLGISYLAIGQNENACKTFQKVGDKTDFEIRNYLIDFCEKK